MVAAADTAKGPRRRKPSEKAMEGAFTGFDVVLSRDGAMLFDGPFLGQLLPVPTTVLSCWRTRILIFLYAHPAVFLVHVAPRRYKWARTERRRDEEVNRSDGEPCARL
jgi:hypothetical protein